MQLVIFTLCILVKEVQNPTPIFANIAIPLHNGKAKDGNISQFAAASGSHGNYGVTSARVPCNQLVK